MSLPVKPSYRITECSAVDRLQQDYRLEQTQRCCEDLRPKYRVAARCSPARTMAYLHDLLTAGQVVHS